MNDYNLPDDKAKIFQELIDKLSFDLDLAENSLIEAASEMLASANTVGN